jgi:hypothetical protein
VGAFVLVLALALVFAPARARAAEPDSTPPPITESAPSTAPPPSTPRSDEQRPLPYLAVPTAERPRRAVQLGALAGAVWRPASDDSANYPASFAYGATVRFNFLEWLGLRLLVVRSAQSVENDAASGNHQPDLDVQLLAARIETSLELLRRVHASAGLSAGWLRTVVPPVEGVATRTRHGNGFDLGAAVTGGYDLIENHLALSATAGASLIVSHSGDMFRSIEAIDANGQRATLGPLPQYAGGFHSGLCLEYVW